MQKIELIKKKVVYRKDPTLTFNQICKDKKNTLLLESSEIDKKNALESMMIIDSSLRISAIERDVKIECLSLNGELLIKRIINIIPKKVFWFYTKNGIIINFPESKKNIDEEKRLKSVSVFDTFRILIKSLKQSKKFPKAMFFGGFFSYDLVYNFEDITNLKRTQKCPDFCFYLSEILLIIDHYKKKSVIQASIFENNFLERNRIKKRINEIANLLKDIPGQIPNKKSNSLEITSNKTDIEYCNIIKKMQDQIKNGEIFQVVPSRKFHIKCKYPLSAYHELKKSNPSPYMFFMQDKDFTVFGASPESSLKYDSITRKIEIYPIAGTRQRGFKKNGEIDLDLDSKLELEMRTDRKELSEHIMLVDIARNDLARICENGTRYVSSLTKVDRYSFVMHLVSRVVGKLKSNLDVFHAYCACMNMGTLTGAPKIRAMQLISEVECERRGIYGGAIGYFTGLGSLDTCIIIRSAYIENDIATVQAGAGIVLDSIPILESEESKNKAKAVLIAIKKSNSKQREK
ncbi:Anthranilate synthase component 1 (plasmid) [Buchnera aphidicola (Neophyllaphis podocarpi)]|uniref:anthranilate synthase component 1 n=1 Tax=Buchnera aphidicola TaxID=9 RepID=UPI0034643EC9